MLSAEYIVGLTDGEGSFTMYIKPPQSKWQSKNYRIECHYYIKLRDDDLSLLKKVKEFFKVGRISFQLDRRPNHHSCYRYETTNLKEICGVIIPFFDQHKLQSKKIYDYLLFKKIIKLVLKKKHWNKKGIEKIKQLKNQMHQYRAR